MFSTDLREHEPQSDGAGVCMSLIARGTEGSDTAECLSRNKADCRMTKEQDVFPIVSSGTESTLEPFYERTAGASLTLLRVRGAGKQSEVIALNRGQEPVTGGRCASATARDSARTHEKKISYSAYVGQPEGERFRLSLVEKFFK